MPSLPITSPFSRTKLLGAALCLVSYSAPALAQKSVDSRVDRLEKEMRAVQRKVFPGGDGQVVSPEEAQPAALPQPIGTPATSPLADLTARLNAIESQLAQVTGQVEENGHRLKQLEAVYDKLAAQQKADETAMQQVLAPQGANAADAQSVPGKAGAGQLAVAAKPGPGIPAGSKQLVAPPSKPEAGASKARTQAVAAIARPKTGNAALDSYTYGYRLWDAKFYPEAEAQLEDTVDKYGKDPIASRAGNLLGRAYLDDNKPTQAAKILYENYRLRPKGDRAAESLALTAEALIQLDRLKLACQAYGELKDAFGDSVPSSVKAMVAKGRTRAKCSD